MLIMASQLWMKIRFNFILEVSQFMICTNQMVVILSSVRCIFKLFAPYLLNLSFLLSLLLEYFHMKIIKSLNKPSNLTVNLKLQNVVICFIRYSDGYACLKVVLQFIDFVWSKLNFYIVYCIGFRHYFSRKRSKIWLQEACVV